MTGYKQVLSDIKSKQKINSAIMATEKADELIKSGYASSSLQFERTSPGVFDIDLAVVDINGKWSEAYQFKQIMRVRGMISKASEAAEDQLKNAPADRKYLTIRLTDKIEGTWEFFQKGDFDQGVQAFKDRFPDIILRLEFSDGKVEVF